MLARATVSGRAHWLVMEQMKEMNGHQAWKSLNEWYEGTSIQSEIATSLRNKIHGASLIPGVSATQYINQFMYPFNKLGLIEGSAMSESEAKDIFLENIMDPEFKPLKEYLSTALETRTLRDLVVEIQKKELALNRHADLKKRVRRQAMAHNLLNNSLSKRVRRAETTSEETSGTTSLPAIIKPNLKGFIHVRPAAVWKSLKKEHKEFITLHNRAVRHSEQLPDPPSGVQIGQKEDDGQNNQDVVGIKHTRRVRRATSELTYDLDKEPDPITPTGSRKVSFNLNVDTASKTDDDGIPTLSLSRRIHTTLELSDMEGFEEANVKMEEDPSPPPSPFSLPNGYIPFGLVKSCSEIPGIAEIRPEVPGSDTIHSEVPNIVEIRSETPCNAGIHSEVPGTNVIRHKHPGWPPVARIRPQVRIKRSLAQELDSPAFNTRSKKRHRSISANLNNPKVVSYSCFPNHPIRCRRTTTNTKTGDRFVCDTGGGKRPTITERAWVIVGGDTGITAKLSPYQSDKVYEHPVVSAVTKATISNLAEPVLLKVNYATYISNEHDSNESESLLTTMDMGFHGIKIEGIHPNDPKCGITVDGKFLKFDWDDDTIFFSISKPTEEELDHYDIYELNSPLPLAEMTSRKRRVPTPKWESGFHSIPMSELRKRFAYVPDEIITKTLQNTTQFYIDVMEENQSNPQKHFRKRFKAIHSYRQNEDVATDFVYFSKNSSQGHKGGQFFVGLTSKRWKFYPLKKECQNSDALLDYIRTRGPMKTLHSDNAQSEIGSKWTKILRDYAIATKTSEPHHQHQNGAEPEWGRLGNMMKNVMRQSACPIQLCHWVAIYCCQLNDHLSRRSLNYKTPLEVSQGYTPDISQFRFYFYEPIWFFDPRVKLPKTNLFKARYLAVAETCGDAMTYYILTEPEDMTIRRQVLVRSVIKSRRKNVGMETEYVNDNAEMESFTLSLSELTMNDTETNIQTMVVNSDIPLLVSGEKIGNTAKEKQTAQPKSQIPTEILPMNDPKEGLPSDFDVTNDAESFQPIIETLNPNLQGDLVFRNIVNHTWKDGVLILTAQYTDPVEGNIQIDTPFKKLKIDEPLGCAKYIKEYIPEQRRGDRPLNDWAIKTIKTHT